MLCVLSSSLVSEMEDELPVLLVFVVFICLGLWRSLLSLTLWPSPSSLLVFSCWSKKDDDQEPASEPGANGSLGNTLQLINFHGLHMLLLLLLLLLLTPFVRGVVYVCRINLVKQNNDEQIREIKLFLYRSEQSWSGEFGSYHSLEFSAVLVCEHLSSVPTPRAPEIVRESRETSTVAVTVFICLFLFKK